jgi:serine/threonine-protein kinase
MSELDRDPESDGLDRPLRAAFGRRADSVVDALPELRGRFQTPRLNDSHELAGPLIDSHSREVLDAGHYRVDGEIARGGVGVVLKGHDVDLGRDVALKVLREEHLRNPDLVARFVEEAQIGGQLQHPGIVPVYELGLRSDRRPFFTMKLVKGQTLAALLLERREVEQDRHRYLVIFEAVCQTMAYAHSRGVVHRDLKPSNVMVGAFGEVQVVDWGLAKVLARGGSADERGASPRASVIATVRSDSTHSASRVGSVMGTPAYMPPEQARGDVDRIDERCDVFSLGAILCEILTGAPPYRAEGTLALEQAMNAELDEARTSLEACGADPELVAIAKACLRSEPRTRPRNANVIAKKLGAYLALADERARAAQLEAAKASARAQAERKARRLTLLLAASLVLAITLGGGGWWWVEKNRTERLALTDRAVEAALTELAVFQARGALVESVATAKRAVDLAKAGGASQELVERAAKALSEIQVVEREARMSRLLEEIRTKGHFISDSPRTDAAYAAAFRDFGIDVDTLDAAEAASRIHASGIAQRLTLHLLSWKTNKLDADPPDRPGLDRLDAILKLCTVVTPESRSERVARAASVDVEGEDPEWIDQLGVLLYNAGDIETARQLYVRAVRARPSSFGLNLGAARCSLDVVPAKLADARAYAQAAIALQPEASGVWNLLEFALRDLEDLDGAEHAARAALELDPNEPIFRSNLGEILRRMKRFDEALIEQRRAVELERTPSGEAQSRNMLGALFDDMEDTAGAESQWRRAIEIDPQCAEAWGNLGGLLWRNGNSEAAFEALGEAIRLKPEMSPPHHGYAHLLSERGRRAEALEHLARWKELDPTVEACELEETLGSLERGLAAVQRGEQVSAEEKTILAKAVSKEGRTGLALRLASEALAQAPSLPEDAESWRIYNAACYAALVAAGKGTDLEELDDAARSAALGQSLQWLQQTLAGWEAALASGDMDEAGLRKKLEWSLSDSDLVLVRDHVDTLPEAQRSTAKAFWSRLRARLAELR